MSAGGSSPGGFELRPGQPTSTYTLFLSSGSDLIQERDAFCSLVNAFNDQLYFAPWTSTLIHLRVIRWEQDVPRRSTPGDGNLQFRELAKNSHSVVVLLHNDIRSGTKDELEAALEEQEVQIHVILLKPVSRRRRETVALKRYLETKRDLIHWNEVGEPGSLDAWLAMTKLLVRLVGEITAADNSEATRREAYREQY